MDKKAGPSLGLTLLAVLVLGCQAGQDLISRERGNNRHAKTSRVLPGAGKDHSLLAKHSE